MDFAALQHSVFLQALGNAILNSLWQCFILWLLYETIVVSYKSASARFKNNLSTVLLFGSFSWFLISFAFKIFNHQNGGSASVPTAALAAPPVVHAVSGFRLMLSYASASLPYLSVAYIFLLLFLTYRLFAAYRYVYFISNKRLIRPERELQLFTSKVAGEIGITRKIKVWISHHIDVPATVGFIKPVILIPFASVNNLSCHQLEAIILHELAHIRRNDYITNLAISVIETILFFNPFVVLLSNVIKRERENCCDDFVLQYRYDPHSYASALLRLEQSRISKLQLAIGAVSGKKQLLSRIKRITNSPAASRQFNYGQKVVALLLVTAVICSVAWLSPEEKKSIPGHTIAKIIKPLPHAILVVPDKVRQRIEVTGLNKPVENMPAINMKHVFSPKNDLATLADEDLANVAEGNSGDDQDLKKDANVFFADDNNSKPGSKDLKNLKEVLLNLNMGRLDLPAVQGVQNFPFKNMKLNIAISKMDVKKLNENVSKAYNQFKGLDWGKFQNEIQEGFSKLKLTPAEQKEPVAKYLQKATSILSKIDLIREQQQRTSSRLIRQQMKKEWQYQDSTYRQDTYKWNEDEKNVQQQLKDIPQQYAIASASAAGNSGSNYYYSYSINNTTAPVKDDETTVVCSGKNEGTPPPGFYKKGMRIYVKRSANRTRAALANEKKALEISFFKVDEKSSDDKDANVPDNKVVSVEVNDQP